VSVPVERIEEVLETDAHEQPIVQRNGRLQLITARRNWYFRPEKPPAIDPLNIGLGKESPETPRLSVETSSLLQAQRCEFTWSNLENVPEREVFFDEDGRRLTNGGRVLTCRCL
jgi:hypothetical protein